MQDLLYTLGIILIISGIYAFIAGLWWLLFGHKEAADRGMQWHLKHFFLFFIAKWFMYSIFIIFWTMLLSIVAMPIGGQIRKQFISNPYLIIGGLTLLYALYVSIWSMVINVLRTRSISLSHFVSLYRNRFVLKTFLFYGFFIGTACMVLTYVLIYSILFPIIRYDDVGNCPDDPFSTHPCTIY